MVAETGAVALGGGEVVRRMRRRGDGEEEEGEAGNETAVVRSGEECRTASRMA